MKILLITTNGITTTFKGWPERLQARGLTGRGHIVSAITYRGDRDIVRQAHETIDGVEVSRFKRRGWFSLELARALLFGPKPDLVHLHHLSNQFAFETALICKLRRIPVVMTPHGFFHDPYLVADRDRPFANPARYDEMILTPPQLLMALRHSFKPKRHLKNFLNHSPLLMMDKVIALSQHGRSVALKLGVKDSRIAVVPNAIDPDWFLQEAAESLPPELAGQEGPLVLYLGQLKYRKGFDLLAKAIPAILKECPQAHFVFTSHSPIHEVELRRLVAEAEANAHVTILHNVSEGQKAALFRQAARAGMYVLPTRYEGFGIPLIEAMSLGCPVVTTDIPVIDEMITDGENGLLFPLEDVAGLVAAVTRLLENSELRARLVAGGLQTAALYFTPQILDQLETLYQNLKSKI